MLNKTRYFICKYCTCSGLSCLYRNVCTLLSARLLNDKYSWKESSYFCSCHYYNYIFIYIWIHICMLLVYWSYYLGNNLKDLQMCLILLHKKLCWSKDCRLFPECYFQRPDWSDKQCYFKCLRSVHHMESCVCGSLIQGKQGEQTCSLN